MKIAETKMRAVLELFVDMFHYVFKKGGCSNRVSWM